MKRQLYFVSFVVIIALIINGCGEKEKNVLARVNNKAITLDEFNQKIERLPKQYQDIVERQKKNFLDDIITEELLYMEALNLNIDKDPEAQEVIKEAKRKILISRLIKEKVDDKISVTDEDIKKYYDEHSEEFMLPERWRASHILIDTLEDAEQMKAKLKEGSLFEELAKAFSKDATAQRGGDIGYFTKGQLIPEFENECFKLEVGQVSDVVKTQFGYHLIELTERRGPELQDLADVKDLIRKELENEQKKLLIDKLMDDLRSKAKITIDEKLLEEPQEEEKTDNTAPINTERR